MVDIYGQVLSGEATPQTERLPFRLEQVQNSAGGFVFAVDDWTRLSRFLVLGSDGGSYYAEPRKLTTANAECVARCLKADGARTVAEVVAVSDAGRASRNDPALFALAMAASPKLADAKTVHAALAALPKVARTGTHLLQFARYVSELRGWGRGLRGAVGDWFVEKDAPALALQAVKYSQREGWALRDLLRLAHPKTKDQAKRAVLQFIAHPEDAVWTSDGARIDLRPRGPRGARPEGAAFLAALPNAIQGKLLAAVPGVDLQEVIRDYRLPREAVPTELLNDPKVWDALLRAPMPMTAMIRNLGKMTAVGLVKPLSEATKTVLRALGDQEALKKARVHPLALLIASKVYAAGKGVKGSLTWNPDPMITGALEAAFYLAFQNVTPAGVGHYLGIDVSGSMSWTHVADSPLSCAEAAAAMAMVQVATEPSVYTAGFATEMKELPLRKGMSLDDALRATSGINFGGTDCAQPMLDALKRGIRVEVFIVYTDNETWAGGVHPVQALKRYRDSAGIPAKLVVVGMTATEFSIADPADSGSLDVVGFDAGVPALIADFGRSKP